MGIRLTSRDLQVIDFASRNPCYTETLSKIFFHGNNVIACRRLALLSEYEYVNRHRDSYTSPYFYFDIEEKLPKQRIHLDLIAKSYYYLMIHGYNVTSWVRELPLSNGIRPDVITNVEKGGKTATIYIEVERYHNSLVKKIKKYNEIYNNDFSILYFCDDSLKIDTKIKVIRIKLTDLANL